MNHNVKPIIVMKFEQRLFQHNYQKLLHLEKMFATRFEKDYYLIALPLNTEGSEEPVRVEVHYDKNFNETKFEALKEYVAKMINGEKVEMNREAVLELLMEHPPMLTDVQIDMWKEYGSYPKFSMNPKWEWNMDKLNTMDSHMLLRLHNEIESFK